MVCKNPRREYVVAFSDNPRRLQVRADEADVDYPVLAVERSASRYAVVALTVKGGPTARVSFLPPLKVEYFENNKLFQTDYCRSGR
jgi:hypothetical protein